MDTKDFQASWAQKLKGLQGAALHESVAALTLDERTQLVAALVQSPFDKPHGASLVLIQTAVRCGIDAQRTHASSNHPLIDLAYLAQSTLPSTQIPHIGRDQALAIATFLLEQGVPAHFDAGTGDDTILVRVVESRDPELAVLLIRHGAHPCRSRNGLFAMEHAILHNDHAMLNAFAQAGVDFNDTLPDGEPPLCIAYSDEVSSDTFALLWQLGARPALEGEYSAQTLMYWMESEDEAEEKIAILSSHLQASQLDSETTLVEHDHKRPRL